MFELPLAGVGRRRVALPQRAAERAYALRQHGRVAGRPGGGRRLPALGGCVKLHPSNYPPVIRARKGYEKLAWAAVLAVVAAAALAETGLLVWLVRWLERQP